LDLLVKSTLKKISLFEMAANIKKNFSPSHDWPRCQPRNILILRDLNRSATRNSIVKQREIRIVQQQEKGEMTMKVSIITLAMVFALSSSFAMAQSGGHSHHTAASPTFRSAMNSMPVSQSQQRYRASDTWSTNRFNGHGISRLGVTTNEGRRYNGG
jgi:hypothetical protein